jgi:hypothetical protein
MRFSNRKTIWLFQKKVGTLDFHKNTPELFQNYVLVTIILHIGPCLSFVIMIRSFP